MKIERTPKNLLRFQCSRCGQSDFSGSINCGAGIQSFTCSKCEQELRGEAVGKLNEYEMLIYLQEKLQEFFDSKGC